MFVKTAPKQTEIYMNNKPVKRTDIFFGSALIENIIPERYSIAIEKIGYQGWQKNLEVREREVTEIKNVILFPQKINFTEILKNIERIWISEDKKIIALKEKDQDSWALKIYDLEKELKSHLLSEKDDFLP